MSLWHLAKTLGDRARLGAGPGLPSAVIDEFLRACAPVVLACLVKHCMQWRGAGVEAGDWILL